MILIFRPTGSTIMITDTMYVIRQASEIHQHLVFFIGTIFQFIIRHKFNRFSTKFN